MGPLKFTTALPISAPYSSCSLRIDSGEPSNPDRLASSTTGRLLVAALIARAKGWKPRGAFRLGIWAWPVNLAGLTYGVLAIINMTWPRSPQDPWYSNYGMIVVWAAVFVIGLFYAAVFRPYDHGDAPEGDAYRNL